MATCLHSITDFGCDLGINLNTKRVELSRTDEFVRNHLLNEIWRTDELSPIISKLVTKIKLTDGRSLETQTKESNTSTCHESISCGCDDKHFNGVKEKSEYQRDHTRESDSLFETDPILKGEFPPHEHLAGTDNVICNAFFEDGRQEGCVWKDNVVRYNNPFDPRLKFDGLLPDQLKDTSETKPYVYRLDTYNCFMDILNPSGFTNSYLKNYRQRLEELRRGEQKWTQNTWDVVADNPGRSTSAKVDVEFEIPDFVGGNSECVDLWRKIEPTQKFWTREDYKWLDNVKSTNTTQNLDAQSSVSNIHMGESVHADRTSAVCPGVMPTDTTPGSGEPRVDMSDCMVLNSDRNDGKSNTQRQNGFQTMQEHVPHLYRQYEGHDQQSTNTIGENVNQEGSNLGARQPYNHVHTPSTLGIESKFWSNGETGDYAALKNVHTGQTKNHIKHVDVHQYPVSYFPVVPELTTSMFWSHQKREYQNKQNALSQNILQDIPQQATCIPDDSVPIPYERNGKRCDDSSSHQSQSMEVKNRTVEDHGTNIATSYHAQKNSQTSRFLPTSSHEQRNEVEKVRSGNGYHSYSQPINDYQHSFSNKRRINGVNRRMSTNFVDDMPSNDGGYVFAEVTDRSAQRTQLVNVDTFHGIGQDLKFDDEVWYINGVPHQHAKPLCPQNSNFQYAVDVAPDGWSRSHGWSTGPPLHTSFRECQVINVPHDSALRYSQTEYNNSATVLPPTPTMSQYGSWSTYYPKYNSSDDTNKYHKNKNNNGMINEAFDRSINTATPKITEHFNLSSDSELSPTSSMSVSSTQSSSNEVGFESAKESSVSDTPVGWLDGPDIQTDSDSQVWNTPLNTGINTDESREYDSCDSSELSQAINKPIKPCSNSTRKSKRSHALSGKQIKVLNGSRTTSHTQNKKHKRQRGTRTATKSCLIKIV